MNAATATQWLRALRGHDRLWIRLALQRVTDDAIVALVLTWASNTTQDSHDPTERRVHDFVSWAVVLA